jgi:hypothetical protein
MSLPAMQVQTKGSLPAMQEGSIQLVKNNYEIIVASFVDHVYVKVTNLINYSSYESKIHSYDSTHEYIKTTKDLWNIIKRAFKIIECKNINILKPPNLDKDEDFICLKLSEQNNNIVLTIYYNLVISFEFNITLNKIKSESSIIDKHQIDSTTLTLDFRTIEDISVYSNLKVLTITSHNTQHSNFDIKKILISNTLEVLINRGTYHVLDCNGKPIYGFNIINISKLPNLKCLQFEYCHMLIITPNNLLDQLKAHPNKTNIELIFKDSRFFNYTIEEYRTIGLKSVTVL